MFACSSESADHVLSGDGKFEEIIVCSQEIAASTAQLVAASNVSKCISIGGNISLNVIHRLKPIEVRKIVKDFLKHPKL